MHVFDDTELDEPNPLWDSSEWIQCNRSYRDVPRHVCLELTRAQTIPKPYHHLLPSQYHSPASFSNNFASTHALPEWNPAVDNKDCQGLEFSSTAPSFFPTTESLADVAVPSFTTLLRLESEIGQSWLDGACSIKDSRTTTTRFLPLWYLSFLQTLRNACKAKTTWNDAFSWLHDGCLDEEPLRERAMVIASSVSGWTGNASTRASDVQFEFVAQILGDNYLTGSIIDALLDNLTDRLEAHKPASSTTRIANTHFANVLSASAYEQPSQGGYRLLRRYETLFSSNAECHKLYLVLYSPPVHWASCLIDFRDGRVRFGDPLKRPLPWDFKRHLITWLKDRFGLTAAITNDLPCAVQTDAFNCPIIAVNTISHNIFGDSLWSSKTARSQRIQAFCTIMEYIAAGQDEMPRQDIPVDFETDRNTKTIPVMYCADDDTVMDTVSATVSESSTNNSPSNDMIVDPSPSKDSSPAPLQAALKRRQPSPLPEEPLPKRQKPGAKPTAVFSIFAPRAKPSAPTRLPIKANDAKERKHKREKMLSEEAGCVDEVVEKKLPVKIKASSLRTPIPDYLLDPGPGGISSSQKNDRLIRNQVKAGVFVASDRKLEKLRQACMKDGGDPNVHVLTNDPCSAICSRCQKAVKLKAPYQAGRFRDHWFNNSCKAPKLKPAPSRTLKNFLQVQPRSDPPPPRQPDMQKRCPGLTRAFNAAIGHYLDSTSATGGGAQQINHYVKELYGHQFKGISSIKDDRLSAVQKDRARQAQALARKWRNDTSPMVMAVFSMQCCQTFKIKTSADLTDSRVVCSECLVIANSHNFLIALNKPRESDAETLKFTPRLYSNPTQAKLFAKREGLESFLRECNDLKRSPLLRFSQHVAKGHFKNSEVFLGLVETMVMGTERELRGVGMQNFKYPQEFRELMGLVHAMSPKLHRLLSQHFRVETARSIKNTESKRLRYPLGIQSETYEYARQYCADYNYPPSLPLVLSVDDSKLFATMQPLFDGPSKKWYLVGLPGETQLEIPDIDALEALMKENHTPATKLRLWVLQIPLPAVPPLALAMLPISSKIKAPELAEHQIKLAKGLVAHGFRFISNAADGAAIERDCQRRLAACGSSQAYVLRSPVDDYPNLTISLYNLDGNIYVNMQDALHARKTGRNNISTGARGLIVGDFVVYYNQLREMALIPDAPLFERDVIRADRQDDNAATRVFSTATLKASSRLPEQNMGLTVLLFIIGDLIDAYESHSMQHEERIKVALRAKLFFQTWRQFLKKQGYSEARHYISQAADDIYNILIDGLIGLIIIHRDHLPKNLPLLMWKHLSMGDERLFSAMRDISPDFSLVQAILMMPRLRATMRASTLARFAKAGFRMVASGYQFNGEQTASSLDYNMLSDFPSDLRISQMYGEAIEENSALWSLLNVPLAILSEAPEVPLEPFPIDLSPDGDFLSEDDVSSHPEAAIEDLSIREELQAAIDMIAEATNLTNAESDELEACTYAAAALLIDNLGKIDNLPELEDPEQLELARADVMEIIQRNPTTLSNIITDLQESFGGSAANKKASDESTTTSITDISPTELEPLVAIRASHQTEKARVGVRNYKPSKVAQPKPTKSKDGATTKSKNADTAPSEPYEISPAQEISRRVHTIIRQAQERGSSSGLSRQHRWKEGEEAKGTPTPVHGNVANAAAAAQVRSSTAMRRRKTLMARLGCRSIVSEARVSAQSPLHDGAFVFVMEKDVVLLGRVITMYSKGGGKAGKHNWVSTIDSIGALSFALLQTFEHAGGRVFKRVHRKYAFLGMSRFMHAPAGSILTLVDSNSVKVTTAAIEIKTSELSLFRELKSEAGLIKAVTTLNTVQRKGKSNVNVSDLEDTDDVE